RARRRQDGPRDRRCDPALPGRQRPAGRRQALGRAAAPPGKQARPHLRAAPTAPLLVAGPAATLGCRRATSPRDGAWACPHSPRLGRGTVAGGAAAPRWPCIRKTQFQETCVEPKVFLDYTQKALDDAYNQRKWAPIAEEVIASYTVDSAAVRTKYPPRTFRYGPSGDETLDWFATEKAGAPVMVFIHGGAWRSLTKEDSAAPAPTFIETGAHYVALNFATIPKVRLPDMVAQCRRALVWVRENAARLGGDPDRIYVSGHSSGGHLCGTMLTTDWTQEGAPADLLKGGLTASGTHDLEPAMLSARGAYLQLTPEEIRAY